MDLEKPHRKAENRLERHIVDHTDPRKNELKDLARFMIQQNTSALGNNQTLMLHMLALTVPSRALRAGPFRESNTEE